MHRAIIASVSELPRDPQWLGSRPCPVIGYGAGEASASADVLVPDLAAAHAIEKRVLAWPVASMTLVQVLRSTALLPAAQALDVESMAFATLQGGEEFAAWQRSASDDRCSAADQRSGSCHRSPGDRRRRRCSRRS